MTRRRAPSARAHRAHRREIEIVSGDLLDQSSITSIVSDVAPTRSQSRGAIVRPASWSSRADRRVYGAGRYARSRSIRQVDPAIRFYQASSSEMFGKVVESPQQETTPFYPRSPYGVAKSVRALDHRQLSRVVRLYACSGICFNHESPRRGKEFVTRKISTASPDKNSFAQGAAPRNLTRSAIGLCGRFRARDVADLARLGRKITSSPRAGRTAPRVLRIAFEVAGWARTNRTSSPIPIRSPGGSGYSQRRSSKARRELGWSPKSLRGARRDDGRSRYRASLHARGR